MTHDELLEKIDNALPIFDANNPILWSAYKEYLKALRAVVELHKPDMRGNCDICSWIIGGTGYVVYSVCPTIQAIEKELK